MRTQFFLLIFIILLSGCSFLIIKPEHDVLNLNKTTICYIDCHTIRVMDEPRLVEGLVTDDSNMTFLPVNCLNAEIPVK